MHCTKIFLALCCVCAVLATTQAFATTWIIDPAGTYTNIQAAYSDPGFASGDTILLTAGYTYTGNGLNVNLTFAKNLTLGRTGVGADPIIDMEGSGRFCTISTTATVSLNNLYVTNGLINGNGGAILSNGTLNAFSCTFSSNSVTGSTSYGGAIYNYGTAADRGILHAT